MNRAILFSVLVFFLIRGNIFAQSNQPLRNNANPNHEVDFPQVPRVSAYEAYLKAKSAKAIIVHAGGMKYELRHIMGALNINQEAVRKGQINLPKLPRSGVEIFTYCY